MQKPPGMLEKTLEKMLFASRWLLAPVYAGLAFGLVALGITFFVEMVHVFQEVLTFKYSEANLVMALLALVDMALVGSLIVMVMFSGYENFVSKLDVDGSEQLDWLGKLDAGTLKLKVAVSIVAISSIHLLRIFMNVEQTESDKLMWYVIIHLTFVVSAVLMAVLDKIAFAGHREH